MNKVAIPQHVQTAPSSGYDLVGFIFTNTCNFRCSHCCNESEAQKVASLDVDEILRCVDESARCEGIREIGISGGEPFLFRKTLSTVIRYAAERGLPTQVTTNAFWARSEQRAYDVLAGLREDGLRGLNLSTSRFHLEFIRPERLVFAAQAAVDLGLVVRVNYVTSRSFHLEDSRRLFGRVADALEFLPMPCIPAGRAAVQVDPNEFEPRPGLPLGSCERFFRNLAIDFTGGAYPCCSPGGFTEPLRVGNIREQSVDEILDGMDNNLLIQILRALGPTYFAPFIRDRLGDAALDRPFVDQCHFCHTIMTDARMEAVVRDAVAQLETDLSKLQWDLRALLDHVGPEPADLIEAK